MESSVVCNEVKSNKGNYGYNAATGKYGDMLKGGFGSHQSRPFRPAKRGLYSSLLLTPEASVVELPKKRISNAADASRWRMDM